MCENFSIGIGGKGMASFALQLLTQHGVIFDDAVVYQRDFPALIKVRVGVVIGHLSVRGPAGVANAVVTNGRSSAHQAREVSDAAGALARFDLLAVNNGDAG